MCGVVEAELEGERGRGSEEEDEEDEEEKGYDLLKQVMRWTLGARRLRGGRGGGLAATIHALRIATTRLSGADGNECILARGCFRDRKRCTAIITLRCAHGVVAMVCGADAA